MYTLIAREPAEVSPEQACKETWARHQIQFRLEGPRKKTGAAAASVSRTGRKKTGIMRVY